MKIRKIIYTLSLLLSATPLSAETAIPNDDYTTLEAAVDAIVSGTLTDKDLRLDPGVYELSATIGLPDGISIRGKETARTIIKAADGLTDLSLFEVNGANNVTLRNLTFAQAGTAISIINLDANNTVITNNVFYLGEGETPAGTAINIADSSAPEINFNTFHLNKNAIAGALSHPTIKHNIFSQNETALENIGLFNTSFNCYFENTHTPDLDDNSENTSNELRFVKIDDAGPVYDFHQQSGGACIDSGDTSDETFNDAIDGTIPDMGAYGGPEADFYPYPITFAISDVEKADDVTGAGEDVYRIRVTWQPNQSYYFATTSNYKLYFDNDMSGLPLDLRVSDSLASPTPLENPSPLDDGQQTILVFGFKANDADLIVPSNVTASPSNQQIDVTWDAVAGASSYTVLYGKESVNENASEPTTKTSFRITGLDNESNYQVAVVANAATKYFFQLAVEANINGRSIESLWDKAFEVEQELGEAIQSAASEAVSVIPEQVVAFPNLPNEGCFVATAAFGFYSSPQVQTLRDFRDEFLLKSRSGTTFVKFYYTYGPYAAAWLNNNEGWKPVVRAFLYPYIAVSKVFNQYGLVSGLVLLLLLNLFGVGLLRLIAVQFRGARSL